MEPPNDPKLSDGGGLAQPVRAKVARVGSAWLAPEKEAEPLTAGE